MLDDLTPPGCRDSGYRRTSQSSQVSAGAVP